MSAKSENVKNVKWQRSNENVEIDKAIIIESVAA
jgi:hypothetical protein